MKSLFPILRTIVRVIALLIFFGAVVLTLLGAWGFVHVFAELFYKNGDDVVISMAIKVLKAIDLCLIAVVLYVFSLGLMILFNDKTESALPVNLPEWLKVKNFMQLKIILWEAILTTALISYVATQAEKRINDIPHTMIDLIAPASILLIALSLFFLKKGEH